MRGLLARLTAAWRAACARVDALPVRDRHVALAGVLAVAVAADLFWVQPLSGKRSAVVTAIAEQAQSAAAERAAAEQALAQAKRELDERAKRLDSDLQRLGAERSSGEPLAHVLRRVLTNHGVRVVALRDLEVIEVDATNPAAATTPAAPAVAAANERTRTLFKHRLELTVSGDARALLAAIAAIDRDARPLRIERVRLAAVESSVMPQASITLAVLGTQRNWLSI